VAAAVPNYNLVILRLKEPAMFPATPPTAARAASAAAPSTPAPPAPADLSAVLLARAFLSAGIPLSLLLDLAAGDSLDSAEILAVEQATALCVDMAARERAARGDRPECAMANPGKRHGSVA
jgi:hypothetical protein